MDGVEAVLLVGGLGTRLRPLTVSCPKPMLPVAGVPFVLHQLARARGRGRDAGGPRYVVPAEVFACARRRLGRGVSSWSTSTRPSRSEDRWGHPKRGGGPAQRPRATRSSIFNGDVRPGTTCEAQLEGGMSGPGPTVTLHLVEVADARAFGSVPTDADRARAAVPREDRGTRPTRRDQRRLLRLPSVGRRRHPERAGPCRWSARPSRATRRGRCGAGLPRVGVLARRRHAGGLRPWVRRPRLRGDQLPPCPGGRGTDSSSRVHRSRRTPS